MAAAAAPAKQLTREQAIDILQSRSVMAVCSDTKLEVNSVHVVEFEVYYGPKLRYKFEEQPFRIMRRITRPEYEAITMGRDVVLRSAVFNNIKTTDNSYYIISTD